MVETARMQFLSRTARDGALEENQAANSLGVHLARHSAVMERIPFQADAEMTRKVIGQLFNHLGNNVRRLVGQSTRIVSAASSAVVIGTYI
jgi:hypothetical protein